MNSIIHMTKIIMLSVIIILQTSPNVLYLVEKYNTKLKKKQAFFKKNFLKLEKTRKIKEFIVR